MVLEHHVPHSKNIFGYPRFSVAHLLCLGCLHARLENWHRPSGSCVFMCSCSLFLCVILKPVFADHHLGCPKRFQNQLTLHFSMLGTWVIDLWKVWSDAMVWPSVSGQHDYQFLKKTWVNVAKKRFALDVLTGCSSLSPSQILGSPRGSS